jgi:hypothetical protein
VVLGVLEGLKDRVFNWWEARVLLPQPRVLDSERAT